MKRHRDAARAKSVFALEMEELARRHAELEREWSERADGLVDELGPDQRPTGRRVPSTANQLGDHWGVDLPGMGLRSSDGQAEQRGSSP